MLEKYFWMWRTLIWRGNLNRNITKACSAYYDKIVERFIKALESTLLDLRKLVREVNEKNIDIYNIKRNNVTFIINIKITEYLDNIYEMEQYKTIFKNIHIFLNYLLYFKNFF